MCAKWECAISNELSCLPVMNCDAVIDKPVLTYSVLPPCFEFLGGCKTIHPILSHRHPVCPVLSLCLSCVCDVGLLWANGCTNQGETWHASRPRSWPHCVRWGPISPQRGRGSQPPLHPSFQPISPYLLSQNGWMDQDDTW